MNASILIVDDEKNIRYGLADALKLEGYQCTTAENGKDALSLCRSEHFNLVISDLKMPLMNGQDFLKKILQEQPRLPVIILTGHGTIHDAVEAMRLGAYDFLTKPLNLEHLALLVKRALSNSQLQDDHIELKKQLTQLQNQRSPFRHLLEQLPKLHPLYAQIKRLAPLHLSVLIQGERGVGKELIADEIQRLSTRNMEAYIKIHCGTLSPEALSHELFGEDHLPDSKSSLEKAHTGTLLLEEIETLPAILQRRLLRVLQEGTIKRNDGTLRPCDVRILALAHPQLLEDVHAGRFREDLYAHLSSLILDVPALRERREDLLFLIEKFTQEISQEQKISPKKIHPKALKAFLNYLWPGNMRELYHVLQGALILSNHETIQLQDLPQNLRKNIEKQKHESAILQITLGESLESLEGKIILATLQFCKGNKSHAAEILGLSRKTLYRKLDHLR